MALVPKLSVPYREGGWQPSVIRRALFGHGAGSGFLDGNPSRGQPQATLGGTLLKPWPYALNGEVDPTYTSVSPVVGQYATRLKEANGLDWNCGGVARDGDCAISVVNSTTLLIGDGMVICPQVATTVGAPKGRYVVYNDGATSVTVPEAPTSGRRIDAVGVRVTDQSVTGTDVPSEPTFEVVSGQAGFTPALPALPPKTGESHWGLVCLVVRDPAVPFDEAESVWPENAWEQPLAATVVASSAAAPATVHSIVVPAADVWVDINTLVGSGGFALTNVCEVAVTPRRDCWYVFESYLSDDYVTPLASAAHMPRFTAATVAPRQKAEIPGRNQLYDTGAHRSPRGYLYALLRGGEQYVVRPYLTTGTAGTYGSWAGTGASWHGTKMPRPSLQVVGYPIGRGGPYRVA